MPILSSLWKMTRDPVLRRWRLDRLRGRWPVPQPLESELQPFLDSLPTVATAARSTLTDLPRRLPNQPASLKLQGLTLSLQATQPAAPFTMDLPFGALQSLHGFDWLPRQPEIGPEWVSELWRAWVDRYGQRNDDDPIWQPALVVQRSVNILDYAVRVGLPGPRVKTLEVLKAHRQAIVAHLSYRTGSVAIAQGHAIYRLGVELGEEAVAQHGLAVLTTEARHLAGRSGVLAAGSTAVHLGLTRCYADAWLAAWRHQRPEAARLAALLRPMLAVLPALTLPGGFPTLGDVPFDWPPNLLEGLLPGGDSASGWTGLLSDGERLALQALKDGQSLADLELLRADGWLRLNSGAWSGLWHASPLGWTSPLGPDHQDLGGFELHFDGVPIFVDPGSPPLTEDQRLISLYRSAKVHNSLTLDSEDPFPPLYPFYNHAFRQAIAGEAPVLRAEYDGVGLCFESYRRLGGPGEVRRRWRFEQDVMTIEDCILGTGRFSVNRRLVTPCQVIVHDDETILRAGTVCFSIKGGGKPTVETICRWNAQGDEEPLSVLCFGGRANLPWRGCLTVSPGSRGGS